MTQPIVALFALLLAFWEAWRLLALRVDSGVESLPLLLVLAAVSVPLVRRMRSKTAPAPLNVVHVSVGLGLYIAATLWAPPLIRIGVAAVTMLIAIHHLGTGRRPSVPFVGLVLLALPVLPSLEFFLAYPLRVASAGITAGLLRMNGFQIVVEGVALRWGDTLIQFDAACSGVRMLWGALFLSSAVALIADYPVRRYALLIAATIPLTIFANALRAASLFYIESDAAALSLPAVAHELTGVAAFGMLAVALLGLGTRLRPTR